MGNYLRIDEEENAVDSLEKAAAFIREGDPVKWKWVSIALHMALYSFCICALQGTDYDRVLKEPKRRGKQYLISFVEAVTRIQQDQWMRQYVSSKTIVLSESQKRSINFINKELRNNFVHYIPLSWSIEVSGMPAIVEDVIQVIEQLVCESGNIHLKNEQRNRAQNAIDNVRYHLGT